MEYQAGQGLGENNQDQKTHSRQRELRKTRSRVSAFLGMAFNQSAHPHVNPIQWKDNKPMWVNQWPLTKKKLGHIHELIQEQLKAGHIEPTNSPWNTPILTIPRKATGKWRLLHDLKAVNTTVHTMRAWQPGLPAPSQIPLNWSLIVVNLRNFFFHHSLGT